ncbi:MAG: hypothetical protein N2C14_01050, partial [Planctomycetales bacterium]
MNHERTSWTLLSLSLLVLVLLGCGGGTDVADKTDADKANPDGSAAEGSNVDASDSATDSNAAKPPSFEGDPAQYPLDFGLATKDYAAAVIARPSEVMQYPEASMLLALSGGNPPFDVATLERIVVLAGPPTDDTHDPFAFVATFTDAASMNEVIAIFRQMESREFEEAQSNGRTIHRIQGGDPDKTPAYCVLGSRSVVVTSGALIERMLAGNDKNPELAAMLEKVDRQA